VNRPSAVVPGRTAEQAAQSTSRSTHHSSGSLGASRALHKGLSRPGLSCPTREAQHTPPAWGLSPSPVWAFSGRWWEALTLLAFCSRLALPCSFPPPSLLLPGPARAFQAPFPSSPALCFPLADPQEALQKGKGESLGVGRGLSRHQHKVSFVTPRALGQ